jgi:hypothetical protein
MKKSAFVGVLVTCLMSFSFAACGGSEGDAAGDGDGTGDGDAGGDGDSTGGDGDFTGGDGDAGRTNIPCVAATDATDPVCVNETDCASVEDGTFRATAKDCLLNNCLGDSDQAGCVAECLVHQIGVTLECSTCYGGSAECSAANCLGQCAADGDAPQCTECQAENGCTQSFFACSGLALP